MGRFMVSACINILIIFFLVFMGYYLCYKRWFDSYIGEAFSLLVLNLALPVSMFMNIIESFTKEELLELLHQIWLPLISIIVTFGVSILYSYVFNISRNRQGVFQNMFTFSNTIFLGLPITIAVFGEKAIPLVLLYYLCNTLLFWTVGVWLMARDNPVFRENKTEFNLLVALKKIFSPALNSFILGVAVVLLKIPTPPFMLSLLNYIAPLTTPLSMFFIGILVYETGIKNLKFTKEVAHVLIGRYVISPLIVVALYFVFPSSPLMLQVCILQAAMPVPNTVPILAGTYNVDKEYAATCLSYSILFYLLYIPILLKFLL